MKKTKLNIMMKEMPDRAFDVGIAEQHAVTFAAGMAASGLKPFCAIYSTFLQRGYDQVVHDVALQKLPVRFAIDREVDVGRVRGMALGSQFERAAPDNLGIANGLASRGHGPGDDLGRYVFSA